MRTLKQPHDPGVFREFCSPWDTSQIWALPHGGPEPGHGCMCPRQQQAAASCLGPGLLLTHPTPLGPQQLTRSLGAHPGQRRRSLSAPFASEAGK